MERNYSLSESKLVAAVSAALKSGYQFLPHDRVVSINSTFENIKFFDDLESIMNRIMSRNGTDWFHLVKPTWHVRPFSISRVQNDYRGAMDFVDQRSWGPYFDFHVRKVVRHKTNYAYEVRIHLYAKFWSPQREQEVSNPESITKDYKQLCMVVEKLGPEEFGPE